jgi:Ca2+-transporting ATPase
MSEEQWYSTEAETVLQEFDTSEKGLSDEEAEARIEKYGYNELVETGGISPLRMFLNQFTDPMVVILLIAIVISLIAAQLETHGEGSAYIDAIVIGAIVIFNAVFGFVQEYRSEQALAALKEMAAPTARVLRGGRWIDIDSKMVVPGDIINLEAGDKVAADGRLTYAVGLSADEAILTGESVAVRKSEECIDHVESVGDMKNMMFSSTTITSGKGRLVVTSTGMNTKFGKIAEMVQEEEKDMTPLQLDLEDLGKKLGALIIVLCIVVFGAELIELGLTNWVEELLTAIALAVSAIPEGLPAVVTITLAIGVQRMVDRNAIVRRLPSVETLGSTTIICSDKTGTITKNEMTVRKLYFSGREIDVIGVGYNRKGEFHLDGQPFDVNADPVAVKLLQIGQLCSNSLLQEDPTEAADWTIVGDPTEGSLLVAAEKAGLTYDKTWSIYKEIHEISFDSARKRMTSICKDQSGMISAFAKGAPEVLLPLCSQILDEGRVRPITEEDRSRILSCNESFADNALRLLAFAYKENLPEIEEYDPAETERDLIFVGLQGMIDPPRDEVLDAIKTCGVAGIRPIMITGDHQLTARAIAADVGLIEAGGLVYTGAQIDKMSDLEFEEAVRKCNVFARVNPEHKLRIVNSLKGSNEVVAMTGDGVNDAPAVKAADVGISMGIRGSDVTKEASDVILTDDNFATIVSAVEKGREIYSNIKKFVRFLLAANFDEVFTIFLIIMLGLPLPITAIQILWLNLATDGFPALALGVDPPEKGVMDRPPRKPGARLMDRGMISYIIIAGGFSFLSSIIVFMSFLTTQGGWIPGITGPLVDWTSPVWASALRYARTAVFASVVSFELLFVWNVRSEWHPIWKSNIRDSRTLIGAVLLSGILTIFTIYVPFFQGLFQTSPLSLDAWVLIFITISPAILIPTNRIFGFWRNREAKKIAELAERQ